MKEFGIDRVKQDLNTIQQALGLQPVLGWDDAWFLLGLAGIGIVLVFSASLGSQLVRLAMIGGAAVAIFVYCSVYMIHRYRTKQRRPASWREARIALVMIAIIMPALVAFGVWVIRQGLSHDAIFSALTFSIGLAYVVVAFTNRNRLSCIGFGVPAIVLAFYFPTVMRLRIVDLAIGLLLVTSGLLMSGIVALQLRSRRHG